MGISSSLSTQYFGQFNNSSFIIFGVMVGEAFENLTLIKVKFVTRNCGSVQSNLTCKIFILINDFH